MPPMDMPPGPSVGSAFATPQTDVPETIAHETVAHLTQRLMKRQVKLSLAVGAVFVTLLVGLPLLNQMSAATMATRVGPFTVTWLILAILFYPLTWGLSWWFVKGSEDIEEAIVTEERARVAADQKVHSNDTEGEVR